MKKTFQLIVLTVFSLTIVNCTRYPKNTYTLKAALIRFSQTITVTLASKYPNMAKGSPDSITGVIVISSANSTATTSATNAATSAANSILEPSMQDAIAKSKEIAQSRITFNAATCNNTTQTVTGTYTTSNTTYLTSTGITTTATATGINASSGSYIVVPKITTTITFTCSILASTDTSYTSTSTATYTNTGTLEITFTGAAIKYFNIVTFVQSKTFAFKTATLTGTVSVSAINQTISSKTTTAYNASTGKTETSLSQNTTYSDKSQSGNLVVSSSSTTGGTTSTGTGGSTSTGTGGSTSTGTGGSTSTATAVTFDVSSEGIINTSQTYQSGIGITSCYNALSYESGSKVSGVYSGAEINASYNLATEDYKKYIAAAGSSITMCQ